MYFKILLKGYAAFAMWLVTRIWPYKTGCKPARPLELCSYSVPNLHKILKQILMPPESCCSLLPH